jgi:uncharacterized repeat protein (TIGR02543 family)
MNVIKRIGFSVAIIAAIAIGPVAISTAGASGGSSDAPPSGSVIVNNIPYASSTQDPACDFDTPDNSTTFGTIQGAVNYEETQASPEPIYVCASTYNEGQVVVTGSDIELFGSQWDTSGDYQGSSYETVLNGNVTYVPVAGPLTGDRIEGFVLQNSPSGPEIWAPGVGSGWTFGDNIIDTSTGGIYFNTDNVSSPDQTYIAGNEFIESVPFSTSGNGFAGSAVYFGGGQRADNVSISFNDFKDLSGLYGDINTTGNGGCGTPSSSNSSSGLTISYNYYEEEPPLTGDVGNSFVNLVCTVGAQVLTNTITVTDGSDTSAVSPIYLGGGDYYAVIQHNNENGYGGGAYFASGVEFTTSAYATDNADIGFNTIAGFGEGVYGYGGNNSNAAPSQFNIDDNIISGGLDGVAIYAINGSPSDGSILGNTLSDNVLADCVDLTSGGSGTENTLNSWTLNAASSTVASAPAGLCKTNAVTPGAPPAVAYAGGSGYTPTATALSGDTTTTTPAIVVSVDASSTGCYLAGGDVGYTSAGICVLDYNDPGHDQWGPASAQLSFNVGPGASGGSGGGAAPASATSVTLTFNSEGGTSEPAQTVASGTNVTLPTPTLTGDTFLGWFTASSGGTLVTSPYDVTASTTLYAQWEANSATPASQAFRYAFTVHTFVFGSSALTSQIKTQLNHLVVLFNAHAVVHATLRGNATLPNNSYNQNLAKARALAVAGYMRSLGIHASLTITSSVSGATYNFAYLVVYVTTP